MISISWADLFVNTMMIIIIVSGIPLLVSLLVGVVVSILQAATQIQEPTLTFVPKVIGVFLIFALCGDYLFGQVHEFSVAIFETIPQFSRQ